MGLTFALFARHLSTFLSLTLLVVTPILIAVDGVWGGYLAEGGDANPPRDATAMSLVLTMLIVPPLVTALLAVAVQTAARGEDPSFTAVLRAAAPRMLPAMVAVALFSGGVLLGFLALIVPGVWLSIRWYFCAQAVVVESLSPADALRRSAAIVATRWWRTLGVLLAFSLVILVLGTLGGGIASEIQDGAIYMTATILIEATALALGSIFATLLFFDTRARATRAVGLPA